MISRRQSGNREVVTMPLIFGPSGSGHVWPRELGHLRAVEFVVDEELHFHTVPRRSIVYGPASYRVRVDDDLTPALKRRRKRVQVNNDRERADQYDLENRLADE